MTRSRKKGPFPQKSDSELDLSADSAKSVVHAREKHLTLARRVPKLRSFKYHTRAYLSFEISAFISVLQASTRSLRILPEVDTCVHCLPVLLRDWAAANGLGGSPSHLCRRVVAPVAGGLLFHLHRSKVRQWGLSACT